MKNIILLKDYRNTFASKFNSVPYQSGINIDVFITEMKNLNYEIIPFFFNEIDFSQPSLYKGVMIIYQSTEAKDPNGEYKSYIDDVLYFLEISGALLIPNYTHFKTHANKVFMEMYREGFIEDENKPTNHYFGSFEDFQRSTSKIPFPVVIKKSHGAQSRGVKMANNKNELKSTAFQFSQSSKFSIKEQIKEKVRKIKYSNYTPYSSNRNKFIIQSFTPGLSGDFKILVFHDIFFIIKRDNRPNDFRASGGGLNSFAGEFEVPEGIFEYAQRINSNLQTPYSSLDIGINESGFNLIEFQTISFGTSGHSKSDFYFRRNADNNFEMIKNNFTIEYLYSYSIANYLKLIE